MTCTDEEEALFSESFNHAPRVNLVDLGSMGAQSADCTGQLVLHPERWAQGKTLEFPGPTSQHDMIMTSVAT